MAATKHVNNNKLKQTQPLTVQIPNHNNSVPLPKKAPVHPPPSPPPNKHPIMPAQTLKRLHKEQPRAHRTKLPLPAAVCAVMCAEIL